MQNRNSKDAIQGQATIAANPLLPDALSNEDGNKIIAEFMGVKIGIDKYSWRIGCAELLQEKHLSYHKEWGWIMPVVDRVINLTTLPIPFGEPYRQFEQKYKSNIFIAMSTVKIEHIYKATVDFIKWYNECKAVSEGSR